MNILFVCTGNTCRSPMAEALLAEINPSLNVKSAGLFAMAGQKANEQAIKALQEKNIQYIHVSQPVTNQILKWADYVFTMTVQHKQTLFFQFPHYQEKYFTLKEFVGKGDQSLWNQLKEQYEYFEEKRMKFIQENEHKMGNLQLQTNLEEKFKEEIEKIEQLEANVRSYDVSDPFGGDLEIYRKTREELEENILLLNRKLKDLGGHAGREE